jgi:hypothetical protein
MVHPPHLCNKFERAWNLEKLHFRSFLSDVFLWKKSTNLVLKWEREKYILGQVVLYRIIPKHRGETHAILQKS